MPKARTNQTALSDEQIIAALMHSASLRQAADTLGISPRALYDRMGYRDFKAAYSAAKAEVMRQAVQSLNAKLAAAIEVIAEIMTDDNTATPYRLQAAKLILDNTGKFTARLDAADKYIAEQYDDNMNPDKW